MCHWRSRPAVRGAGPARTAREGHWGAPPAARRRLLCASSAVTRPRAPRWGGPAGHGAGRAARRGCAEAERRTRRRVCGRELSDRNQGAPLWPRGAFGVALAVGEFRVETTVGGSLERR